MIEEKYCAKCEIIRSKFSEYCAECGTKLDKIHSVNGQKVQE